MVAISFKLGQASPKKTNEHRVFFQCTNERALYPRRSISPFLLTQQLYLWFEMSDKKGSILVSVYGQSYQDRHALIIDQSKLHGDPAKSPLELGPESCLIAKDFLPRMLPYWNHFLGREREVILKELKSS